MPYCDGHDFAIVAERFVVDYWAFRIARLTGTPVFDMNNADELQVVRHLYGNEQTWEDALVVGIGQASVMTQDEHTQ